MVDEQTARRGATRLLAALGVAGGSLLLARPQRVVEVLAPAFPRERLGVVRLLGARLVGQHAAVFASPNSTLVNLGSAIDLTHAVSMIPFLASPRYGRAARISGGVAAACAVAARALAPRSA